MNKITTLITAAWLILITTIGTGCAAIEGIFKAGMWWGILMVVGIIALVIFIISKMFGNKS